MTLHDRVTTKKRAEKTMSTPQHEKLTNCQLNASVTNDFECKRGLRLLRLPQHWLLRSESALTTAIECNIHVRIHCEFHIGRLRANLCAICNGAKKMHCEFRSVLYINVKKTPINQQQRC